VRMCECTRMSKTPFGFLFLILGYFLGALPFSLWSVAKKQGRKEGEAMALVEWRKSPVYLPPEPVENFYFHDLPVIHSDTKKRLTADEITKILVNQPNIEISSFGIGEEESLFDIDRLAYPQYANRYELTQKEWHALQAFCQDGLHEERLSQMATGQSMAADEVINHWKSIVAGTPPFGLKVQNK
jgi:hypothetical protein